MSAAEPQLRDLPTSLLVTLRPGASPEAIDTAAAERGLVRVAWSPALRTAQYVALPADAGATTGAARTAGSTATTGPRTADPGAATTAERHIGLALAAAGQVDGRERARLTRMGAALDALPGVEAARPPFRLELVEDPTPAPEPTPTPSAEPTSEPSPSPTPTPSPTPVPAPDDTYWSTQWGPDAIGARAAWAITRGRPEIVVAVLDSGVDLAHPDLAGRLVPGIDLGSGDRDPSDEDGHGTHVAGIIAAASNNGRGVAGVAPGVVVMPIKVMNDDGDIWDSAVAEGIAWAVARGARVINLSLGGPDDSAAIDAAIDDARAKGAVVVAAAGNHRDGDLQASVDQPGAYGPVLAVAAVSDRGADFGSPGAVQRYEQAAYSNSGPEVDIAAPGTSIMSTFPTWESRQYVRISGTSMATPFVSAAAALVISRDPSLTADQVEAALLGTAADLGAPGPDPETGAGLVRADAAVASIPAPPSDGAAPLVRVTGIADGTVVRGSLNLKFAAADASPILAVRVYRDHEYLMVRRRASVEVAWNSRTVRDGLHAWTGYATDGGLQVGSTGARVLVANGRAVASVSGSLAMTATARSISRAVALARTGPFVARVSGPSRAQLVIRLVDGSGRVVATARGTGSAALALPSLRAGRYTLRASATVAQPGSTLRFSGAWFR